MKRITATEREEAFRMKLRTLLESCGAEMEITDDGKDYGMHSAIVRISMYAEYDDEGNMTKELCEFEI